MIICNNKLWLKFYKIFNILVIRIKKALFFYKVLIERRHKMLYTSKSCIVMNFGGSLPIGLGFAWWFKMCLLNPTRNIRQENSYLQVYNQNSTSPQVKCHKPISNIQSNSQSHLQITSLRTWINQSFTCCDTVLKKKPINLRNHVDKMLFAFKLIQGCHTLLPLFTYAEHRFLHFYIQKI